MGKGRNHDTPPVRRNYDGREYWKLIGRTGDAVRTKARELGISMILKGDFHPSAKYRQSDIELARQLHQCGVPRREIAEKLEMPLGMINQYVYFERRVYEV